MITISYTFDKDGKDVGTGMEAETILDALTLVKWLEERGYYNVTMKREENTALTVAELIAILKTQPQDAKILIEDFNGAASTYLQAEHVIESWARDNDEGTAYENVMMLTTYKEEETS